jgi:hypothetical protein
MIKREIKTHKFTAFVETALFVLCLVVISLRATFTEAPATLPTQIQAAINDTVYSLCLSGALISAFILWVLIRLWIGRASHYSKLMTVGLIIFTAGMILATIYASNKRAAITSAVTVLSPILMAFLLAGLLNSQARIKILLIVITSLGVVQAWQSAEQYFVSNGIILEQYKNDPNSILQPLGIEPGSFNHILLEHRIYSKDVRASFTTSNSAGSFAIMTCFAAIALLLERLRQHKTLPVVSGNFTVAVFVLAAVLFSLLITRSKGAIAAFSVALTVFALLQFGRRPTLTKNLVLTVGILGVVVLIPVVGWYGLKFGRLPGGNSMLVRWQYWLASVQMFFDHALTGVGGGNFTWFYPHYKVASAPETISDPHCFLLSIATQYSILGLAGFLIIVLVPLYRASMTASAGLESVKGRQFGRLATVSGLAVVIVVLLVRPFIIPPSTAKTIDEKIYVFFTEYIATAAAFAVGFGVLIKSLQSSRGNEYALQNSNITTKAIFCGLLGVLIHNLIDYAILEPGVYTAFCGCLGYIAATDSRESGLVKPTISSAVRHAAQPVRLKAGTTAAALAIGFCYFNYALIPVAKSTAEITKAGRAAGIGQYNLAHGLLVLATDDDPLSPEAPSRDGRLYLQHIYGPAATKDEMLKRAEEALFTAVERNPEDYKNFEALGEVFFQRAQIEPEQKEKWLDEAVFFAARAVELYPGSADLHFRLAQLAEELGQNERALKHYKTAVEIEDGFRAQFRIMYPGREVFSRLPEEKYESAKERMKQLSSEMQNRRD